MRAAAATGIFLPIAACGHRRLESPNVVFKKHVLDSRFVAEGVTVADVDRDGRLDILAGNVWYQAPHWVPHEIAPYMKVDPVHAYSNCFNSWAEDLNGDGWEDQIVIGMPGDRAYWRENPKGGSGPWKEHPIWRSACNESPLYVDLLGNGKRVLVMGYDDNYLAWFEPAADPYVEWNCHNVSGSKGAGSYRYAHGLGVGDINSDGRNEILTIEGYYVSPEDPRAGPWRFVPADLGPECAQMCVRDLNADGRPDVVTSSAHNQGVWWFEQNSNGSFERHLIDDSMSETHSLVLADLRGDGGLAAITGKRKWAHPPGVDVRSGEASLLVWYELKRTANGIAWDRHVIDDDSGVGTQFVVRDMTGNGRLDIVISNKNGVFFFEQKRTAPQAGPS